MKQIIRTDAAPASPLFSQAVRAGSMLYLSGITGVDARTGQVAGATIEEQTRQALANCAAILGAAGSTLADVVEVQVLLARPEDFAGLNREYARTFASDPPARSVARLGVEIPGLLVSIRMTACTRLGDTAAPFEAVAGPSVAR